MRHFAAGMALALCIAASAAGREAEVLQLPVSGSPARRPSATPGPGGALLATHALQGRVAVRDWKALRDDGIVKQDLDFSCGAASLATLLNAFYREDVTEEALLQAMDKGDGRASFEGMVRGLWQFGYRAQGFAASWEQLTRLRMPVIVHVRHRKGDHFSVLRGIGDDAVWLADPSLGHRTYGREQFMAMWRTRADKPDAHLAGRFLAVLPASAQGRAVRDAWFLRSPPRHSAGGVGQLAFRPVP